MKMRNERGTNLATLMKRRLAILSMAGMLAILGGQMAHAQLPETINYQGRLSHAGGALVNGTLAMSFAIYNDKNAATPLWTESYAAVQVTNGQFSVDLGSVTPLTSLTFDEKYWLGITVGADPEMTPRKPFTSVGYAVRALHAQNADHSNNSDHAVDSDDATHADDSDDATHADNADYATTAGYASSADTANSAAFATSAGAAATATSATSASHADTADTATSAGTADNATHATTADTATNATNATHATSADTATNAGNAALADDAAHAQIAEFSRSVREAGMAIVVSGLRGGAEMTPGLAVYVDPATAMTDRATWCPSPGESSPCLLKIMPGVYEPGPTPLTPVEWVAIEGSGEDVTTVRLDSSLHPVDNAEIRSLTLELVAPSTGPAVDIVDDDVRFAHVTIQGYPGASSPVVRMNGSGPGPTVPQLRDVTVEVTDGTGLEITNGSPVLSGLSVKATSSSSSTTTAVNLLNSAPVMTGVSIDLEMAGNGDIRGIHVQNGSHPVMHDVRITGRVPGSATGGQFVGMRNQDSSPDVTGLSILIPGGSNLGVLGILNESNSNSVMRQVTVTVGSESSSCGPPGIFGIRDEASTLALHGATVINRGADCSQIYGLTVHNSDVRITNSYFSTQDSFSEGISCEDSMVELTGSTVRSAGNQGIVTERDCRFRIDHSLVAGQGTALRDNSTIATGAYYLIGASKFIGLINQGGGHARFECIASYEEMGDSLNELQPDCN